MPYTPETAQENMQTLIERLVENRNELSEFIEDNKPDLSFQQIAEIRLKVAKLDMEIEHRQMMAAFDAAAATVVRPPTDTEVSEFQKTLEFMGKEINSIATFSAVIKFAEDVMTKNAQRFVEILKTIQM